MCIQAALVGCLRRSGLSNEPKSEALSGMDRAFVDPVGRGHLNQGMIAPGNHWIMDSLRGAPLRRPASLFAMVGKVAAIKSSYLS